MGPPGADGTADDDEDFRICGCDFELEEGEDTLDHELPAAHGGVQTREDRGGGDESADGCDLDFDVAEPTSDAALPAARGGVR